MSGLVALAAHARDVPSETREAFGDAAEALARDPRAILLRTCHRVELYLADEPVEGRPPLVVPVLPAGARRLDGAEAARHVFAVAAGLDSVVVGEDQVLHQLRECLADRRVPAADGCPVDIGSPSSAAIGLHPVIERLFQVALHLGRETRSWREGPPTSLADLALDAVATGDRPLVGRRVLIVGAGRMARLTALAAARRGAHVLVANRSAGRAVALAADVHGDAVPFLADRALAGADAIVLAIGGRWPLASDVRDALVAREVPVADLSSPPALDAAMRAALGSRYTGVDDLALTPRDQLRPRVRARYDRAIDDAEQRFMQWLAARGSVPAIRALTDHAEARRSAELERLFRRADLDAGERELVVQMSHRLVAGLLHAPLVKLRDDDTGELEQAARTLFAL